MRNDGWTVENDILLAQIVLNELSNGNTQLVGFEKAGETLNRTSAACGFRWNSAVRKQYENELKEAKSKGREAKKNAQPKDKVKVSQNAQDNVKFSFNEIDDFGFSEGINKLSEAFKLLQNAYHNAVADNMRLRERLAELPNTEDLNTLVNILRRANDMQGKKTS